MDIILKGIIYGIFLAFLIGPVFFTILQTSIERGFSCGVLVAIGVSLSDAFYITITYLGLSQIVDNPDLKIYLGYVGGAILLLFGLYYLVVKSRKLSGYNPQQVRARSPFRYIAKGFIINGLSPMVLVFWVGTLGVATTEFGYNTTGKVTLFFSAIVATVFATDVLKAKLADKLRMVLTPQFIRILNIALGVIMIIFGGRLIFYADNLSLSLVIH